MKSNITFETKKSGFNNNERSAMYVLVCVCLLVTLITSGLSDISNASSDTNDQWKTFQGSKIRRSGLLIRQINVDQKNQDDGSSIKEITVDFVRLNSALYAFVFPQNDGNGYLRGATGNGEVLLYRLVESKWHRVGVMDGCFAEVNQRASTVRVYFTTWSGGGSRTTYRIDDDGKFRKGEVTSYRNDNYLY